MAIAFGVSATGSGSNTNSVTPTYPTVAAGDYIVMIVGQKYANRTVTTPAGFTALGSASGGAGTDGTVDQGNVKLWVFGKQASGSESGTITVTSTGGTSSSMHARMATLTKAGGTTWDVVGSCVASDNTAGTDCVFTYDADPGVVANDWLVTLWALNSDAYTHTHALTCSGLTVTTASRLNQAETSGANLRLGLVTHAVTAGPATGVATYTNTASSSAANAPAGASVLIRLREVSAGTTVVPVIMNQYRQRRK